MFKVEYLEEKVYYRVKWEGYDKSVNTWEPEHHLREFCESVIEEFEEELEKKKADRKEKRKEKKLKQEKINNKEEKMTVNSKAKLSPDDEFMNEDDSDRVSKIWKTHKIKKDKEKRSFVPPKKNEKISAENNSCSEMSSENSEEISENRKVEKSVNKQYENKSAPEKISLCLEAIKDKTKRNEENLDRKSKNEEKLQTQNMQIKENLMMKSIDLDYSNEQGESEEQNVSNKEKLFDQNFTVKKPNTREQYPSETISEAQYHSIISQKSQSLTEISQTNKANQNELKTIEKAEKNENEKNKGVPISINKKEELEILGMKKAEHGFLFYIQKRTGEREWKTHTFMLENYSRELCEFYEKNMFFE